jgi:hypothetical protein
MKYNRYDYMLLDALFLMAPFFLTHITYSSSRGIMYSSIHYLKSHPGGSGGGGKSSTQTPFKIMKQFITTLLRICTINVKIESTFLGFSSSQPQLNGEVGNGQDQYLLPYVS